MFWGNSDAKHASGSLRSTIFQLRKEFDGVGEPSVRAHKLHVSLAPELWALSNPVSSDLFLEGFDLPLKGAEGFEEWLRLERNSGGSPQSQPAPAHISVSNPAQDGMICSLGILPTTTLCRHALDTIAIDLALDVLVKKLAQISLMAIYDLRGSSVTEGALSLDSCSRPGLLLRSAVFESERQVFLRVVLVEARTGKVIRSFDPIPALETSEKVEMGGVAERIMDALVTIKGSIAPVELLPWAALSSLFSLTSNALMSTDAELNRLIASGGPPVLRCLSVFLQIFKENEGLTLPSDIQAMDLQTALAAVPTSDPLRAICESLIGYAAHMLCANNELSHFLLEMADRRSPNLALNLDHLAVIKLAAGDLKAATLAHDRCMKVSGLHSWRYSYDITGAMIALARGDYRAALKYSNQSLMQRPKFVGALRYAMISFAMNNGEGNAHLMRRRILQLRPDYDLSGWVENFLRRSDPIFGNNVALTLRDYELI